MHPSPLSDLAAVRTLRARIQALDGETLREQLRIAAIPAPSLQEEERGRYVARRFEEIGLAEVETDEVGNVLARLARPAGAPVPAGEVLVAAHLDTVFPVGTPLAPRQDGTRYLAPGITDNARGLAAMLALARVLAEHPLPTRRAVRLVATVGEEGLGDLRGVKHLFRPGAPARDAAAFISLDGAGLRRVVHRGVASRRLRLSIRGPGGHSWADWGAPNAVHALGHLIATLTGLRLPSPAVTTLTVARVAGGTSVNAIPEEAWAEVDLRSEHPAALDHLAAECCRALQASTDRANGERRHGTLPLAGEVAVIGDRPGGATPADHPLVVAALAATRMIGSEPDLTASSTDANVPMDLGIPAVTIGAGGASGGVHTLDEWYDNRGGAPGIERALLLVLAAAGVEGTGGGTASR